MKTRGSRRLWFLLAAAAPIVAALLLYFRAPVVTLYKCPFRTLTGLDCPGCGMSRAFYFLLHFDFARAFRCNPFIYIWAPGLFFAWLVLLLWLYNGKLPFGNLPFGKLPKVLRYAAVAFALLLGAAMLVVDILRNLPGSPLYSYKI